MLLKSLYLNCDVSTHNPAGWWVGRSGLASLLARRLEVTMVSGKAIDYCWRKQGLEARKFLFPPSVVVQPKKRHLQYLDNVVLCCTFAFIKIKVKL
jgi:hypothetical protein